jgi:L-threonylcarbamoyladenylate synthase
VGIESTIIDCTRGAPVLLRPGVLTPQQLSDACGVDVITPNKPDVDAPRASGTLASHYAPTAQVQLMTATDLQQAINTYSNASTQTGGPAIGAVAVWSRSTVQISKDSEALFTLQPMPSAAHDCAHDLFAQLRAFDVQGVSQIWVELPPPSPEWDGVRDRLTRAATPIR